MPRGRITLFTEVLDFDDSYSDVVWRAVDSRARERDCDLVVCVGRRLDRDEPGAGAHNLLYRLALERPWDALVVAHICYQRLGPAQRLEVARRFEGRPAAATARGLGGVPAVEFENGSGLVDLVNHLIEVHGKRRLVFVSGPRAVEDAQVRLEAWRRTVEAAGLPSGDEWVLEGGFNPLDCPDLARQVADRVRRLGADAVVTSSDIVAEVLLRELPALGFRVPEDLAVTGFDDVPLASAVDPALTTVRQPVRDQFRAAVDLALDGRVAGPGPAPGALVVRASCGCPRGEPSDPGTWRRRTFEAREETRYLRSRVSSLNLFASRIDALGSPEGLAGLLAESMPRLGFDTWSLALACEANGALSSWAGDPFFGASEGEAGGLKWVSGVPGPGADEALVYPAADLAPAFWWNRPGRRTTVALPLAQGGTWYGLALLEIGPDGNLMCRAVQELVSSFLDRERRLKDEVRRSLAAQLSTELEAEKTRTLGLLLAGFSHDLATPFSVGRDSVQLLKQGLDEVGRLLGAGGLSKTRLERHLADGKTLTEMLEHNWARASDLVERFKRIGTEVPRDELRTVALAPFLTDLVVSLQPLWRRRPVTVELEVEPELTVTTRVSALVDIVTNLVQNTLVHAFPEGRRGQVRLRALAAPDQLCRLECEDDGVGVPPSLAAAVFDPYFTTRDGQGGTGLGLAVVRQRAESLLAGTVVLEAPAGGGARFVVTFPRTLKA